MTCGFELKSLSLQFLVPWEYGCVAWSSSLRESLLCNTKHFAGKSMNSNSNSSRLRPMFNGANVHL
eukprot:2947592-Amphidinium_carterae.1